MRLMTFSHGDRTAVGVLRDGWVIDVQVACALAKLPAPPATMRELIAAGPATWEYVRRATGEMSVKLKRDSSGLRASGAVFAQGDVTVLAPVTPGKVIAIGLNYAAHAHEQNLEPPKEPLIFAKFPTSVIADGDTIEYSTKITEKVDYEAELAVVIGKTAKNVDEAEALSHVFGYTVGNDVSARDLQKGDGQWTRAKSLDTFCPLGPAIVTADEVPDPQTLGIRSILNGTVMQSSNTSDMIHGVAKLIAHASAAFTLEPGDVIMTGTPEGVGIHRKPPVLMQDGDRIRIEIDGVGAIENPVRVVG